jgi:hypothetical protein
MIVFSILIIETQDLQLSWETFSRVDKLKVGYFYRSAVLAALKFSSEMWGLRDIIQTYSSRTLNEGLAEHI